MKTEEITPALDPDEWDEIVSIRSMSPDIIFAGDAQELMDKRPHAAAAIALYGQPYGFTREDVNLLRTIGGEYPLLNAIAARIAALLPPEEAKE